VGIVLVGEKAMTEPFKTALSGVAGRRRAERALKLSSFAAILLFAAAQSVYAVRVRVPEGTVVSLTLRSDVTTENVQKGDRVDFDVSDDVVVNDAVVISKGAGAWAIVEKVKGAGKRDAKDAMIVYRLIGVQAADGQPIALRLLPNKSKNSQPSDNDIEASSVLPGPGFRRVGAPKGKQYAAYTDAEAFVNVTAGAPPSSQAAPAQGAPAASSTAAAAAPPAPPAVSEPLQPATVDFRSDPSGGDIVIDGSSIGVTPSTQQLAPGLHDVEIHAQGYQNWKRKMRIEPGSHPTVMARLVHS
jgi:PEGA domain